jgi:DNA-directed RNA polymerase specialized sigma24 family protein
MSRETIRAALGSESVKSLLARKSYDLCHRPGFRPSDRQDVEHDLIVHVLEQARLFDPARGTPGAFIAAVVNSAVAMMIRERHRIKRGRGLVVASLESSTAGHAGGRDPTLGDLVTEADLRRRWGGQHQSVPDQAHLTELAEAISGLAPDLKKIALLLADSKEAAVANDLGISRRQVRNAKRRIREHLARRGMREFCFSPDSLDVDGICTGKPVAQAGAKGNP